MLPVLDCEYIYESANRMPKNCVVTCKLTSVCPVMHRCTAYIRSTSKLRLVHTGCGALRCVAACAGLVFPYYKHIKFNGSVHTGRIAVPHRAPCCVVFAAYRN